MRNETLQIETVVDVLFEENAYVLYRSAGGVCWIVDPGFAPQPERIASTVRRLSLRPEAILVTHCHADHIAGIDFIARQWPDIGLWIPAPEEQFLTDPEKNLSAVFNMPITVQTRPDRLLNPSESLYLDGLEWRVLDCRGHSPGGLAFYCPAAKTVPTGDALFAGSIGRTDLPGSDAELLINNIKRNLLALPEETVVLPGHGPSTTVRQEKLLNPFLKATA